MESSVISVHFGERRGNRRMRLRGVDLDGPGNITGRKNYKGDKRRVIHSIKVLHFRISTFKSDLLLVSIILGSGVRSFGFSIHLRTFATLEVINLGYVLIYCSLSIIPGRMR